MSVRNVTALAGLAIAAALAGCARKPPEPVKTPPPPVVVDYPVVQKVNDYEDFAGRTEPFEVAELKSRVTGYLTKIHFTDGKGQDVEEGKQLFDIDNRIYKAELDRAYASQNKAEKHLRTITADYLRVKEQYDKGVTGQEALDKSVGDKAEAEADIDVARAAVETAETNLRFCHITAPFEGRLSYRKVDVGALVKADDTLLTTIVRLDQVYATFDIDERTVIRVRKLIQKGEVTSSRVKDLVVQVALADDDDFTLSGVVKSTDNQIDPNTGTLRVRAVIPNPRLTTPPWYMLSPGQFVRVRLPIGQAREAILVPEKAIGSDQGQRFVYVVVKKEKDDEKGVFEDVVQRRDVRVGQQYGQMRVIEDGVVTPADRIVVDGLPRVRRGLAVAPKPAGPASRPGAADRPAPPALAPAPHEK